MNDIVEAAAPSSFGRGGHMLLQFSDPPTVDTIAELENRGVKVLQTVPENGLLVAVDGPARLEGLQVRYAAPIAPFDKISPLIAAGISTLPSAFYLAEFHPDVDMPHARTLLLNLGLELRENSDLHPRQLMVRVLNLNQLADIAALDEVAYVFPASDQLVNATPVRACAGAIVSTVTSDQTLSQIIAANGPGWDGNGLNATSLNYIFGQVTTQVAAGSAQSEIQRAMAEWSKAIKLTWVPTTSIGGARTVNILFARGVHGDGYPFDGPFGVMAHTFYPSPPNSEPLAGDMHFDEDEIWSVGANTDIFSIALHELGHALGLGHSDNPADVMYPYYRIVATLAAGDTAAIQTMYAPQDGSGGGETPAPLTITVVIPPSSTTSATIPLNGTISGGAGAIGVTWSTNQNASGTASIAGGNWSIASIPLAIGVNSITVTATDDTTSVSNTLTITRTLTPPPPPPPPSPNDTTAPALTISSPGSTVVSTASASLSFLGKASDNVDITSVTWSTNTGKSGTATGTNQWSTVPIPLLVGSNTITIRAYDAAGNMAWRSVVVKRR